MEPATAPTVEKTYVVRTKDDKLVTVGEHVIRESKVLSDAACYMQDYETEIPIPDITAESFERCVKFFDLFKDEPTYVPASSIFDDERPYRFDRCFDFLRRLNPEEVQDISATGSYLNAPRLIDYLAYTYIRVNRGSRLPSPEDRPPRSIY